jgi:FAD/FMN-containing dehydrogenase
MRRVVVDSKSSVATLQGGTKAKDVISAAAPYGLVAATGNCDTVGMVGLTLGGGYGPLTARYGLALDNLISAELVLADGRLVRCDSHQNPDLFWALRGGGGNFGAVTSMRVQLHPVREMLAGMILFPWAEAKSVLRGYTSVVAAAPDELGGLSGVVTGPDGNPMVFLAPMWSGEPNQGEGVIAELRRLGTPSVEQIAPMAYGDLLGMFADHAVAGRHYAIRTRSLPKLTPDIISTLIAAGETKTSPFSAIILHHFRGTATRVPLANTSFGLRSEHFMAEVIAAWEPAPGADGEVHRQWAITVSQSLEPYALPGGYPNMLGPDDHEQTARAYGANASRLQRLKRLFDPEGIFTSAISLPLQREA